MTNMNECPACKKDLIDSKCRYCGMERVISNTSGNTIFMRNGRVFSAPQDEKEAKERMLRNYPHLKKQQEKMETD